MELLSFCGLEVLVAADIHKLALILKISHSFLSPSFSVRCEQENSKYIRCHFWSRHVLEVALDSVICERMLRCSVDVASEAVQAKTLEIHVLNVDVGVQRYRCRHVGQGPSLHLCTKSRACLSIHRLLIAGKR